MQDVVVAWRHLRSRPGFASAVVLTLALGIGANALVFSAVRAVLLAPLPFPSPEQLVNVWQTQPGNDTLSAAPANFLDWRSARSFEGLAAYNPRRRSLTSVEPERINAATVSANFFRVLGVAPAAGRDFGRTIGDGEVREVLLRDDFWRTRFAADASLFGRTIRLDDELFTVVGTIPAALAFPEDVVVWMQARHDVPELGVPVDIRRVRDSRYFRVIGRLAAGVTIESAQAEMDVIAERLRAAHPDTNTASGVNVVDLKAQLTGSSAQILWLLLGTAACVLAIACANVATLLLAAAVRRGRELAVRAALGATRARLARQLAVESVLLASAGAAAGLAIAWSARPALVALLPAAIPRLGTVSFDASVLVFTLAVAASTAILFGVTPALMASRQASTAGLRSGGSRTGASRSSVRMSSALVVAQLGIALTLVTGTGLIVRMLWTVYQRDTGMDLERVLAVDVTLPDARSRGRAAAVLDIERMVEGLAVLPGASSVGAIQALPLATRGPAANLRVDGRTFGRNEAPDVSWRAVTPGYFRTVGARLLRGRLFTAADREGGVPVAIVNATLARRVWPDADPLGQRIGTGLDGDGAPVVIVGVIADIPQDSLRAAVRPEMYRPLSQPARFPVDSMSIVIRSDGDPAALGRAARGVIRDVHPQAPVGAMRTMAAVAAAGLATERSAMAGLAVFGGLAILLAAIGLYGVLARLVGDRSRELGIRLALGARPQDVRRIVLRRTLTLAATGSAAGAAASLLLARQLGSAIVGAGEVDPLVFGAAVLVLGATAFAASYLPARRASRIDPLSAIRSE